MVVLALLVIHGFIRGVTVADSADEDASWSDGTSRFVSGALV